MSSFSSKMNDLADNSHVEVMSVNEMVQSGSTVISSSMMSNEILPVCFSQIGLQRMQIFSINILLHCWLYQMRCNHEEGKLSQVDAQWSCPFPLLNTSCSIESVNASIEFITHQLNFWINNASKSFEDRIANFGNFHPYNFLAWFQDDLCP